MSNKIIAVDFDGTLCRHAYPKIGEPIMSVIDAIKKEISNGAKVILWTCRSGEFLNAAVSWCREQGIEIEAVNEDVPSIKDSDFGREKSCKVFAHEYWDDRNKQII